MALFTNASNTISDTVRGAACLLAACLLTVVTALQTAPATARDRVDIARAPLASAIGDRTVSFLARDLDTGRDHVLEASDLTTRHTPWSTFKIPNLVIALETGIAPTLEAHRTWDQDRRPPLAYWPDAWRQDQTLRTAFERSAVWYFQDLALDVGSDHYRTVLADWSYGNGMVADGSDRFWLDRSLKLSVEEQVAFLENLLTGRLDVSPNAIDALVVASFAMASDGVALHGKTGAGPVTRGGFGGPFEGWYSGFVLRPGAEPVVFSLHAVAPSFSALRDFRRAFSIQALKAANLLPPAFPD